MYLFLSVIIVLSYDNTIKRILKRIDIHILKFAVVFSVSWLLYFYKIAYFNEMKE